MYHTAKLTFPTRESDHSSRFYFYDFSLLQALPDYVQMLAGNSDMNVEKEETFYGASRFFSRLCQFRCGKINIFIVTERQIHATER